MAKLDLKKETFKKLNEDLTKKLKPFQEEIKKHNGKVELTEKKGFVFTNLPDELIQRISTFLEKP